MTNSGKYNSGSWNSGNCNSGNYNSGGYNSRDYNSGQFNSGIYNSGKYNSGSWNSGNYNSGCCNSGDYNSGNYNSGQFNSGRNNSGSYNSGNCNSGYFNTTEPTVRMFNKDTGLKRDDVQLSYIKLPLTYWVCWNEMSTEDKTRHPEASVTKGYLVVRTYKEAWAVAWSALSEEKKQEVKALPNFCPDIFEEITGIDVRRNEGKLKVEANGKAVYISKDSAIALGLLPEGA